MGCYAAARAYTPVRYTSPPRATTPQQCSSGTPADSVEYNSMSV